MSHNNFTTITPSRERGQHLKTDYYLAIKIPGKEADSVMAAMEVLCEAYGEE